VHIVVKKRLPSGSLFLWSDVDYIVGMDGVEGIAVGAEVERVRYQPTSAAGTTQ